MPSALAPNVIVFGETGVGKSSIIQMLEGGNAAITSDRAEGTTFASTPYNITIRGSAFNVFDTAGLNEAPEGRVPPRQAIENLFKLISQLENGINLLVYVLRGPRIVSSAPVNYKMFFEGLCRKKVPIAMAVTGLEASNMDTWWNDNKPQFDSYGMSFKDVACITATKGKIKNGKYTYATEYDISKTKVENLIYECHAKTPWKMSIRSWFFAVAFKMREFCTSTLGFEEKSFTEELASALQSHGGFSSDEAITASSAKTPDRRKLTRNVIVFGETGVGKSSILNMLEGDVEALVGDHAVGVTFGSMCYQKKIDGTSFNIYDTVGLDEGSCGTVTAKDAVEGLYRLIRQLEDGVNLLIYVMRAPRVTRTAQANYRMFFDVFCGGKVPIAIIITGLENRESMDGWWDDNKATFDKYNMQFKAHACITATQGKQKDGVTAYAVEYEDSKWAVESLILRSYGNESWQLPAASWFKSVAIGLYNIFAGVFGFTPKVYAHELCQALKTYCGLSHEQAVAEARRILDASL